MFLCDIDSVWADLLPALHDMRGLEASPDEIRRECKHLQSLCWRCRDGCIIGTLAPSPDASCLEFVVWIAVSWGPHGAVTRNLPAVDRIAKELGASRVVFYSPRRGWERDPRFRQEERSGKRAYVRDAA